MDTGETVPMVTGVANNSNDTRLQGRTKKLAKRILCPHAVTYLTVSQTAVVWRTLTPLASFLRGTFLETPPASPCSLSETFDSSFLG